HAKIIGIDFKVEKVDWDRIGKRRWSQIDESKDFEEALSRIPNLTVYRGVGEFVDELEMRVKLNPSGEYSDHFRGRRFTIASGARSFIPPIEGIEETGYATSESFFGELFPQKPWESLIIVGGGIVAAEFAHLFSSVGTEVTVVEMGPRLVATEEPEISEFLERNFRRTMNVLTGKKVISAHREKSTKVVAVEDMESGEEREISAAELFIAAGRRSNTDLLKVERSGIDTDGYGWIKVNQYLETTKKNVWSIGDANGVYQFRHKANYDAEICVHNMFSSEDNKIPVDYSAVPWAIYSYPEIGHVGMTEKEARETDNQIYVGVKHYSSVAKGFAMGYSENDVDDGFVKLIVDTNRRILGAHVVGPNAAILIQPFVYLMNAGYTCGEIELPAVRPVSRLSHPCPEAGSTMPIYRSMIIHPSLNEVTGWSIGSLKPIKGMKG
ncbi:dihydrolipoyl dehydrogenase family protein, partial [[Eubacterium] cellulosolvens]